MSRFRAVVFFCACVAIATNAVPTEAQQPPTSGTARATLSGLRNNNGQTICLLFASADGFPTQPAKAARRVTAPIASGTSVCTFQDVPPGTYAVAAMHDENNDGKMNKNLFGKPTEGHGASNDSHGGPWGSPKFDEASFLVRAGATTSLPIPIHY